MKRTLAPLLLLLVIAGWSPAQAQSGCPYIAPGAVLTAGQWQACFESKLDVTTGSFGPADIVGVPPISTSAFGNVVDISFAYPTFAPGQVWGVANGGTAGAPAPAYMTPLANYTLEQFGATANQTSADQEPFIDTAITTMNTAGGGTLVISCNSSYWVDSISPNGLSAIRSFTKISITGCGPTSKFLIGNNALVQQTATATANLTDGSPIIAITGISLTGTVALGNLVSFPSPQTVSGGPFGASILNPGGCPGGGCGTNGNYTLTSAVSCPVGGCPANQTVYFSTPMFSGFEAANGVSDAVLAHFSIDMNGAGNSCSGHCGGIARALGIFGTGANVVIDDVSIFNNGTTNNIQVGDNVDPPTIKAYKIINTHSFNSGDRVNAADYDHSSLWMTASSSIMSNNTLVNGASLYGVPFEFHGYGITAEGNTADGYAGCANISNEATGNVTTRAILFQANSCQNVNFGVVITSFAGATGLNGIQIIGNNFLLNAALQSACIDAGSQVAASTTNIDVLIALNRCDTPGLTSSSRDAAAILIGPWQSAKAIGNTVINQEGPCVMTTSSALGFPNLIAGEIVDIFDNNCTNTGITSTSGYQIAIYVPALGGGSPPTPTAVNVAWNIINGTVPVGINDALATTTGIIIGNTISGASTQVSYTGSGAINANGYTGTTGPVVLQTGATLINATLTSPTFSSPTLSGTVSVTGNAIFTGALASITTNGQASFGADSVNGAEIIGKGSGNDFVLKNNAGTVVCLVAVGSTSFNCLGINNTPIGAGTPNTAAFTTLSASGAVSGAGFTAYFASPPSIGSTAPGTAAFTTLSASSTVSGTGFSTYLASPPAIGGTAPNTGKFSTLTDTGLSVAGVVCNSGAGLLSTTPTGCTGFVASVATGGTNCAAASGTCLDNITGFASTGVLQRTGAGTYAFLGAGTGISFSGSNVNVSGLTTNTVIWFSSGSLNPLSSNTTGFIGVGTIAGTEIVAQIPIPIGATLKNMYVNVSNVPGGSGTYTFTLDIAGSAQTVTCQITSAATSCSDLTHTAAPTAGQLLDVKVVSASSAASLTSASIGIEAVTTSP